MLNRAVIAVFLVVFLASCGYAKRKEAEAERDFFREECIQTGDQEACMLYNEALLKLQALRDRKNAAAAAFLGRQRVPSTCTAFNGIVQCY